MAKNMEVALGVRLNSSGGSGTLQTDDTAVQTREFYLSGAETTQNNGTTNPQNPLAQMMSSTPPDLTQVEPEAAQSIAQQNAAQQNNEQIVQNKYGQIITIHQLSEPEEMAAATGIAGQPAATDTSGQSKEVNSNYIRSHLPNDAPKTVANENHTKQQDTTKDNQPKGTNTAEALADGLSQTEQTATPKPQFTIGTENQPLVFAHQRTSAPLAASTSSTDALTLRLPSGLTVPDGAVVDQMLSHFSVNKQLESGTINLKLHPQELGELRMEIKVEQDNIKAHIVAQNPQAQEMIERHLPRLRETLAQQGLQLQHIEVTVAAHDNAGGERYQDNSRQQLNQSQHKSTSQSMFTLDAEEEMVESASSVNNLSVLA
jgi:flagellar hook-length control protein FliK